MIFKCYSFILGHKLSRWCSTFNFYKVKNCLKLFLSITKVSLIKTLYIFFYICICQNSMKSLYKDKQNFKNFIFLRNNVKGLQSTKKQLKLFNVLKNKIGPKGILFLQGTHSSVKTEKKWIDDFKDKIYYSHSKTNSCKY